MSDKARRKASRNKRKKTGKKTGKKVPRRVGQNTTSPSAAHCEVTLQSHPGIKNVGDLKTQLLAVHDANGAVVIDAGAVESIDTAALQLLAGFAIAVRHQSRRVEWKAPSAAFRELADMTDLSIHLGLADESATPEGDGMCPVF